MKNYFKILLITFSILSFSCSSDDSGNNGNGGGGGLVAQATYRITFESNFTAATHPTDYPADASFTPMFVVAHGSETSVFTKGNLASPGLELFVEEGDNSVITSEHAIVQDNDPPTIIRNGVAIGPTGSTSVEITITPNTTLLSFVSGISPSPDWFLGVDSFNFVNPDNISLVDEVVLGLTPLDAGTDSGSTYTSDDEESSQNIAIFTGEPFQPVSGGIITNLGTLKIERIDQ